jgi:hypothetical protein
MTITELAPPLADLTPITLDELLNRAALQTRVDRKYILPLVDLPPLLQALSGSGQILQIGASRSFAYQSVYYDTPELACYRLSAHRRRHRFKVRTRTYLDSDECWLEVKTTGRNGTTVKHRTGYPHPTETHLGLGRCFVESVLAEHPRGLLTNQTLLAALTTRYRRSTLYLPSSGSRVTIDTALTWADPRQQTMGLSELAIVETKPAAPSRDR